MSDREDLDDERESSNSTVVHGEATLTSPFAPNTPHSAPGLPTTETPPSSSRKRLWLDLDIENGDITTSSKRPRNQSLLAKLQNVRLTNVKDVQHKDGGASIEDGELTVVSTRAVRVNGKKRTTSTMGISKHTTTSSTQVTLQSSSIGSTPDTAITLDDD